MLKKIVMGICLLVLILLAGFIYWALTPSGPGAKAEYILVNASPVGIIQESKRISFLPQETSNKGLIIYPGGRVDYRSYAPMARELALDGYAVFIVKMPLNMAFFDTDRGAPILADYPEIQDWSIIGHSLGGIAASLYIKDEPQLFKRIIYLASFPPENTDLSQWNGEVLSLRGSEDLLVEENDIIESRPRLPQNSRMIEIEGGNHGQFGDYGIQKGDGTANISQEEQMKQTIEAILDFLA